MGITNLDSLTLGGDLIVEGTETITGGVTYEGNVTLGDSSVDVITINGTSTFNAPVTVGVNDTGHDVTLFGATAGQKVFWDESADTLNLDATVQIDGTLTVGVNDTGYDVNFFGATAGQKLFWDESADTLNLDCTTQVDGTITVGVSDTGYDVKIFGATANKFMVWDQSADDLILADAVALQLGGDESTADGFKVEFDGTDTLAINALTANDKIVVGGVASTDFTLTSAGGTVTLDASGDTLTLTGVALNGVSTSLTGGDTLKNATAVPATAGAVAAGVPISMYTGGITIEVTSDAPTHTRPKGSICINTGGSSVSTRMYVNTDGAGTWTSFTTAA